MVAITRFTATGFAIFSTLSSVLAAPTPSVSVEVRDVTEFVTPIAFETRDFEEDLPLEARDILSGDHDDYAIVNKRFFLTKIAGKLAGGAIKGIAHLAHHRSVDDEDFTISARDVMAACEPVAFDTRDLSEDIPIEVRDILSGDHDDYAVVNKRFFLTKIAGKLAGGAIKGIAHLAHKKHHH